LDWDRIKGFISEHFGRLIWIYNVCGVKDERAWDLFFEIIFLGPVTTHHLSKFQHMCPYRRSRSSPFREWWAAFCSYMRQMFHKTCNQMNNRRWDNLCAFGDQVDHSNLQTNSPGNVKPTSKRFSWYGSGDVRAMIEPPSCRQYKPGDILAVRPLNWDEIIDQDDDDENWANPRAQSGGRSRPSDGNENDDGKGEEDAQGGENWTKKGKATKDGKGKWKGKAMEKGKGMGKGNSKGKGIVKQTPGEDDISRAIAVQLQKRMYEADSDMES
jgi:hypothetical protein